MTNKNNIEELKLQNEMLKNKTEKLRLVRNIVAVASIVISIVSFLILKQDFSSGSNTQVQNNSNSTIQNNNEIKNNINNESYDKQDDDDNDLD